MDRVTTRDVACRTAYSDIAHIMSCATTGVVACRAIYYRSNHAMVRDVGCSEASSYMDCSLVAWSVALGVDHPCDRGYLKYNYICVNIIPLHTYALCILLHTVNTS